MPDDPDTPEATPGDDPGTGEPRGFMVYLAVGLLGLLVILIFLNPMGPGAADSTKITENTWSLQSIADPEGIMVPVQNGTTGTAKFFPTGKLTGAGNCSAFSARYMVKDTVMVISHVTITSRTCPADNVTHQDTRYYAAIEDTAFLRITNRQLTLFGTDGKPLLTFSPAVPGK